MSVSMVCVGWGGGGGGANTAGRACTPSEAEFLARLDAVQVEVCRRLAADARMLALGINEASAESGGVTAEVDEAALVEVEAGLRRLLVAVPGEEDPPDTFAVTSRSQLAVLSETAHAELTRFCHRELGTWVAGLPQANLLCSRIFGCAPVFADAAREDIKRLKMDQLASLRAVRGALPQAEALKAQCAATREELDKLRGVVRATMASYSPLARTSGPLLPAQVRCSCSGSVPGSTAAETHTSPHCSHCALAGPLPMLSTPLHPAL